jgi:hypothetical protein
MTPVGGLIYLPVEPAVETVALRKHDISLEMAHQINACICKDFDALNIFAWRGKEPKNVNRALLLTKRNSYGFLHSSPEH